MRSADPAQPAPRAHYTDRRALFAGRAGRLAERSRRLAHVRTLVFVLLVLAGLWLERGGGSRAGIALAAGLIAFVALVASHQRVRALERWCRDVAALNEEGVHRLDRRWDLLPVRPGHVEPDAHAFAADLDLFGRASLLQILGPAGSPTGAAMLDAWLLHRAEPDVVRERQAAVSDLASKHEFRESLAIYGRRTRSVRFSEIERFLAWAERDAPAGMMLLRLAAWLLPLATWLLIVLHATGVIAAALWLVPMLVTFATYLFTSAASRRNFDEAFGREGMFSAYPDLLRTAAAARFETPLLQRITARLQTDAEPADRQLARLRRLMHLADVRFSLVHVPVYLLTMWDVHILRSLERWRKRSGRAVRDWLAATGELEALSSLATLAHDQPDWGFAEIDADGPRVLEAEALGHPLLADGARVCNDVSLGPAGTFLLVTGSNMSGKSTLLRSVGLNVVLAQAGGPSCARRLRMPPLEVQTSIRVQDSLARGVSYFMAELERLKQIVDAAHRAEADPRYTLLFLLDEILHGTNTAERRIAARRVIRHLVDSGAIGAVTTHDLELAGEPVLAPAAQLVHFQERFTEESDGSTLDFDYRLRQGLATSTNALKLMKLVGLPGEDAGQPDH
jgi:energy-coupling factor transporter ATP-binding protein EcfA2